MARETMATLREVIAEKDNLIDLLNKGIVTLEAQRENSLPTENSGVSFARAPEQLNSVVLITTHGRYVVPADRWMEAVGRVSVGGNNGVNQAIIRKLHLG